MTSPTSTPPIGQLGLNQPPLNATATLGSTSNVTNALGTVSSVMAGDYLAFPDFAADDIEGWFAEFEVWINIYKITNYDVIYCSLMKKLPTRIFHLVGPKIDPNKAGKSKYDEAKNIIITAVKRENKDSIDLFNACRKREDISFSQYLETVRKYAKPENLPKSAIDKKFLASLTPEQMTTAEIVLMTQDIDKVAQTLDNIRRRVNNSSVFMISGHNENSSNDRIHNINNDKFCNDNVDSRDRSKSGDRISKLEKELQSKIDAMTKALSGMESKIREVRDITKQKFNAGNKNPNFPDRQFSNTGNNYHSQGNNQSIGQYNNARFLPPKTNNQNWRQVRFNEPNNANTATQRTCYYHTKFQERAFKCDPPCRFFNRDQFQKN